MKSYKLMQSLELKECWKESKYTDGNTESEDAVKWMQGKISETQIIVVNNVNTFIHNGRVIVSNLPVNGSHHWNADHYKVHAIKSRPYVKVAGMKMFLDELVRDSDVKVCLATTTKAEEWKHFCIGLKTAFIIP